MSEQKSFALIGWPLKNTLSPAIHNAVFSELEEGTEYSYSAAPIEEEKVSQFLDLVRTGDLAGLNVTIPYKEIVARLVDELDPTAAAIRAVNTVAVRPGGVLKGYSTDGEGLVRSIEQNAGVNPAGKRIAVLGAGGAARSAIHALASAGAAKVLIINRTRSRALEAAALSPVCEVAKARAVKTCDIVINATSVGMDSQDTPIKSKYLHEGQLVVDAVYSPLETRLLREAKERGAATLDGLWMLIHQACVAQFIWFAREPNPQTMREAAVRELERRAK